MTGQPVVSIDSGRRRFAVDFPGWSDPSHLDYLLPVPQGLRGTVTYVEQHGSNPWTRYSIKFEDGSKMYGAIAGEDFDWR